jgi:hypothetical protein
MTSTTDPNTARNGGRKENFGGGEPPRPPVAGRFLRVGAALFCLGLALFFWLSESAAWARPAQQGECDSVPLTRSFRGNVYRGSPPDTGTAQPGVTVQLYSSSSINDMGQLRRGMETGSDGYYELSWTACRVDQDFSYYNIIVNDPDYTATAAEETATRARVKAANWIQYDNVDRGLPQGTYAGNRFWVSANSGGTATATATGTPGTATPTATASTTATASATGTATVSPTQTQTATPSPTGTPQAGSITVVVYFDANRDGVRQSSEPLLAGATVRLLNNQGQEISRQTSTATAPVTFSNLTPGTSYTVEEQHPVGYFSTTADVQSVGLQAGSNPTVEFGDSRYFLYIPVMKRNNSNG